MVSGFEPAERARTPAAQAETVAARPRTARRTEPATTMVQAKLAIGSAFDPAEREADAVADQVTTFLTEGGMGDRQDETQASTRVRPISSPVPDGAPSSSSEVLPTTTARSSPAIGAAARSVQRFSGVVQREIGKVPAPYKPLEHGKKAAAVAPPVVASPKTLAELASSAESSHTLWVKDHDVLLDILLGPFEANWFKAKACLTMEQWPEGCPVQPSHDVGITLMQALVVMRKAKWTAFVTNVVKPQFEERMRMFGKGGGPDAPKVAEAPGDVDLQSDLDAQDVRKADETGTKGKNLQDIFDSVGAEAVTSDVDLASGGSNSELGIQFVNSRFRTHFAPGKVIPYDPGTVFDINVYASDWIHGEAGFSDSSAGVRTITPAPEVAKMSADDTAKRTKKMEVWSLVKVRRNMDEPEWESYRTMTLASLSDDTARAEMESKLDAADKEFQAFKANVERRQETMAVALKAQEDKFFGGRTSAFGEHGKHYAEDASFTRAANAIYEETLQTVKELRLRIEKLRADPVANEAAISNLGVLLADKIAEALTYANEVYATEGAVQHTVLKQGAAKKLEKLQKEKGQTQLTGVDYNLKPELYLQAVNENVGDSLHSINHYSDVPKYAVYRAGKYLARLCDATNLLLGSKKSDIPTYVPLLEIGTQSVRVKKITKGDIEGDPKFVNDDPFFKKYTDGDLPTVRKQIIEYGAMVPKLVADKKREEEVARQAREEQAKQAELAKSQQ